MADKKIADTSTPAVPFTAETPATPATPATPVIPTSSFVDLSDLGLSNEELAALSGLDNAVNDFRIPYASLVSKDTREHKKGDIVFADGKVIQGWNGEELEGVSILTFKSVRVYFPTPFNPNNTFVCRSINGRAGHYDGKYAGQECSTCEFSKYPAGGGASPCREQRLLLCTRSDGMMFHIQIGGVGVKEWNSFMSSQMFHLLPQSRIVKGGEPILARFNLTLGVKQVDTANGMFPALQFKVNPDNLFVDVNRLKTNLEILKSYRDLEEKHAETAATATHSAMSHDAEPSSNSVNSDLF